MSALLGAAVVYLAIGWLLVRGLNLLPPPESGQSPEGEGWESLALHLLWPGLAVAIVIFLAVEGWAKLLGWLKGNPLPKRVGLWLRRVYGLPRQ